MFIAFDKKETLSGTQLYVDKDLTIAGASKILSVDADARVSAVELLPKEAKVFFRVNFSVIFEDAEGKVSHIDTAQDYNTVLKDENISPLSKQNITLSVSNPEFAGSETAKIRATVSVGGFVFVPGEANCYPADNENIITRKQSLAVEKASAIREAETLATLDADIKSGVAEVLGYKTRALIKSVTPGSEVVTATGECHTNIIFMSEGSIANTLLSTPFTVDLLAEGASPATVALLDAEAKSTTITLVDGENSKALRLEISVGVKGFALNKTVCEAVTDGYSKTHDTSITHQDVCVSENSCNENLVAGFAGSAPIESSAKKIRNVLAVSGCCAYADPSLDAGTLSAEGIVAAEIIYLSIDNTVERILAEVPYQTIVSREFGCRDDLSIKAVPVSVRARPVGNDRVELAGELSFAVKGIKRTMARVCENIELGAPIADSDVAISLYLASAGESLWDIAKALRTDETNLLSQNDDITLPLKGGEKIVCWNPINL